MSINSRRIVLGLLLVFSIELNPISGQTVGGSVSGTVTDPQGSLVQDALASFKNVDTGVTTSAVTNREGSYRVTNLQPGHYDLTIAAVGFANGTERNITVTVGAELVIDYGLKLAGVADSVDVMGDPATVDVASSTLSYSVAGTTIRELPLNGRDFTSLAILQPGVTPIGTLGGIRAGLGNKLSISGSRPSTNNFLFDGISLNDSGNNTPGSILGVTLGVDAVDQFTLLTDTFSAEYGRAAGGIVNAVTRSGTNQVHGSGFYFGRNSAFDARNYFDAGNQPKPEFRRHQYGGTLGGPIRKDKTFWFFDYEGVRQVLGTTTISTVPSAALRQGIYINPANNQQKQYTVDPEVAKVLNLYPLPNAGLIGNGNTGNYSAVLNNLANEYYLLGKIDHKISDKDSLRGSYFADNGLSSAPDNFLNTSSQNTSRRQGVSLEYTRLISPSVVNVARVGFSRSVFDSGKAVALNPAITDPTLTFVPGLDIGTVNVAGLTALSSGPKARDFNFANYNSFQYYENLYVTRGTHSLRFGFNAERMQYNSSQPNLTGGSFSYGSLPGFLTNGTQNTNPSITFAATFVGSNDERGMRETLYGGYAQDDWRIRKNLTLNLGMRYEMTTIPSASQNKIALIPNLYAAAPQLGGPIFTRNPTLKDFSPRAGLAWNPDGSGKTAIRAGFGIFDNLPLLYLMDTPLMRSFPYFTQGVLTNVTAPALDGSFPGNAYSLFTAGQLRTAYIEPNPARSYTMQWNLNIQHQFFGWVATVGYVGSRGVHLVQVERNMNVVQPIQTPVGWFYPPTSVSQKLNSNFTTINTTDTWNADSDYSAMHVSVSRPLARGLQVQGSYTFGKSIDDSSSTSSVTAGTGYPNAIGSPAPLFPSINRGLSDFNLKHNAVVSAVWDIPAAKTSFKPVAAATKGWELGGIYTIRSGMPFTVVLNSDQAGETKADTTGSSLGERPNLANNPACQTLTNPGNIHAYIKTNCFTYPQPVTFNGVTGTVLGNLARNSLTAPGLTNVDFSLIKNDRFHDKFTTQFRFELFNAFNHPNFAAPNFVIYDSSGNLISNVGQILATTNAARQIQLGLKLSF